MLVYLFTVEHKAARAKTAAGSAATRLPQTGPYQSGVHARNKVSNVEVGLCILFAAVCGS